LTSLYQYRFDTFTLKLPKSDSIFSAAGTSPTAQSQSFSLDHLKFQHTDNHAKNITFNQQINTGCNYSAIQPA